MSDAKPWVDGLTVPQALARTVRDHGGREAAVFPWLELSWTYARFQQEVWRLARALIALGVRPGEHVGIWCTNRPEWILAQFATASVGAVLVNVNPAFRAHELSYILEQSDAAVLIITDSFRTSRYESILLDVAGELNRRAWGEPLALDRFPKLRHIVSVKASPALPAIWPWDAFLDRGKKVPQSQVAEESARVSPHMPVNIQYTSGTTGLAKGVVLSHRNLLMNAYYVGDRMHFSERDRLCIPVPLYHCFGCVMGTLMCSVYGAAMVIPGEVFSPEPTLEAAALQRCTALYGVPTMFNALLHSASFERWELSSLRTGIMAGSPCPIELMRQVTTRMHLPELTIAYGLTEASPVVTQTETSEPLEVRVRTVGRPLPGVEVRLVEPANTRVLTGSDEQGSLQVRGHGVMLGYYRMPEATAAVIDPEGWLDTGDLASRTPTGHYQITGRSKDMLIRGGENIYPREIEEFLLTHPGIRDVQVVGVPDPHYGEQVSAWIIPKTPGALTVDEVCEFCRGRVAHFKIPHYVSFVDEFPLTATGKVQKYRLREMAIERFGIPGR